MGVSLTRGAWARTPLTDLKGHIPRMEGFHRRYMVSNKVLRLWVHMARQLDVKMLVPQHGAPIQGRQAIADFYDWAESLMCGVDLFDDRGYQVPQSRIDVRKEPMLRVASRRQRVTVIAAQAGIQRSESCALRALGSPGSPPPRG